MQNQGSHQHVILSGCSGGGKSTLLTALAQRGFRTVEEPGRRIVAEELRHGGKALPWVNLEAFARRAMHVAEQDRAALGAHIEEDQADWDHADWVFFDRGLIDAAVALETATGIPAATSLTSSPRFQTQVFLTPPWPEIYRADAERQHSLTEAREEYHRLLKAYRTLGYTPVILPKTDVETRADFVLKQLSDA